MTTENNSAVIVEYDDIALGLAVRERSGYRFYASHPSVATLEGRRFRTVHQIEGQARALSRQTAHYSPWRA